MITKTITIKCTESVWKKFERFLSFMHFNGGHSGLFAMPFDGDGSDRFRVRPELPDYLRKKETTYKGKVLRVSDVGFDVEIAYENTYSGKFVNYEKYRNELLWQEKIKEK